MFLHEAGYSVEEIVVALDMDTKDVEKNIEGTGFALDYKRISLFEGELPRDIGDTITIKIPSWSNRDEEQTFMAKVVQCVPGGSNCGLSVILLEDSNFEIPLFGSKKKRRRDSSSA